MSRADVRLAVGVRHEPVRVLRRGAAVLLLAGAPALAAKPVKPVAAAKPAPAAASFDELASEAVPVRDLARLVEPLFDTCEGGEAMDSLERRQCEGARAFLESQARSKTYVAVGDTAAVSVNPYDASMKEVDIDVQGCLACVHPVKVPDGKGGTVNRFVTTKVPRSIKGGKAVGLDVATVQLAMATPEEEAKWKKEEKRVAPRLRAQFVFKLGAPWSSGSFSGVSFEPLGYRVFNACSGEVLQSSPAGGEKNKITVPVQLAAGDTLTCPAPGEDLSAEEKAQREELAQLPPKLSREMIEHTMGDVQEHVHDCHVEFEESGTVDLRIMVDGPTGKVKDVRVLPPFDKSPAGLCVRAAVRSASFTRTRGTPQEVRVPVYLR